MRATSDLRIRSQATRDNCILPIKQCHRYQFPVCSTMVLKTTLLLFLFTTSQVFATSVLQVRSFENLLSRQGPCTICETLADTVTACTTVQCVCNSNIAAEVQACITCGVTNNPTPSGITAAQNLIDAYQTTCASVPGLPSPTIPGTTATSTSPASSSPATVVAPPTTITSVNKPTVVTTFATPTKIVQTTVSSDTTTSIGLPGTSSVPSGITTNGAGKRRQAGLFVIGAMVGAVLAL